MLLVLKEPNRLMMVGDYRPRFQQISLVNTAAELSSADWHMYNHL